MLGGGAALLLFARTVGFGWVYDDQREVVLNTFIRSFALLPEIFTTTVWAGSGMETYLYRPLAVVTYALNYPISGAEPWSYHLVNVLLHAGVAILVVRMARVWGLTPLAAGLAGLLFAVHPVHVEAVAPVFGRKDLLATLFVLGMVLTHRVALDRGGWRWGAAPLLYLAAMLSKEVGVVGIALVAVQDLWLEKDRRVFLARRDVPLAYASYLLAASLYLAVRAGVTGGLGIPDTSPFDNPLVAESLGVRVATAWTVVAKGVGLLALPLSQSPDYSFDAISVVRSPTDARFLAALLGTTVAAAFLAARSVRGSVAAPAAAWYLLALLPASNLLVVSGTIFAERLLYLPSVAFCLVAGALLAHLQAHRRSVGLAVAAVAVVGLSVQAWRYTSVWTDDVTLFRHASQAVPRSTKAHHKLGEELLRRGELGDALRSLHRALEVAPTNGYAAETLHTARAHVGGRYYTPVVSGAEWPEDPEVLYALGAWALEQADTTMALAAVEKAVSVKPDLTRGWLTLGVLRLERGDSVRAREALERFLALPGSGHADAVAWARGVLATLPED